MATKPASPSLQGGNALASGLVIGLLLYEGSGNPSDLSGNGNNGTLAGGASWTTDAAGNAVSCTGGGRIEVPFPAVASGDDFSLCVIHKPTTWPGGFTTLFDDSGRNWSTFFNTSGNLSFSGALVTIGGSEGMTAGSLWQYLYTRDRTGTSNGTAYVNGTQKNQANGSAFSASAVTLHFGGNPSGGGSTYNGIYDAIYLWNRVLSGAEITSLTSDPYQMFRPTGGGTPVGADALHYYREHVMRGAA
jgi:hypothetical protein